MNHHRHVTLPLIAAFCFLARLTAFSQGTYWEPLPGPANESVVTVSVSESGYVLAGCESHPGNILQSRIYRSGDWGVSWDTVHEFPAGAAMGKIWYSPNGIYYTSCEGTGMWSSMDGGATWENRLPLAGSTHFAFYPPATVYASCSDGVLVSSTNGLYWDLMQDSPANAPIAFAPNRYKLYAADSNGAYRYRNDGTWPAFNAGWSRQAGLDSGSMVIDGVSDIIVSTQREGCFRSADAGEHWTPMNDGMPADARLHVDMIATNPVGDLFSLPSGTSCYRSASGTTIWKNFSAGLPGDKLRDIAAGADGYMYIAAGEQGIFRTISSTSGVPDAQPDPGIPLLNSPNPFSAATTISFDLPADTHVSLSVFEATGRIIGTLVDGRLRAGSHHVRFDAAGLPAGAYIYRLQAGAAISSKTMTVVK